MLMATQAVIMINVMGAKNTGEAQPWINPTWVCQIWAIYFLSEFMETKVFHETVSVSVNSCYMPGAPL